MHVTNVVRSVQFCQLSGDGIPFQTVRRLMAETMVALDELHAHRIIHGDLNSENILVDVDERIALSDFGQTRGFNQLGPKRQISYESAFRPDDTFTKNRSGVVTGVPPLGEVYPSTRPTTGPWGLSCTGVSSVIFSSGSNQR